MRQRRLRQHQRGARVLRLEAAATSTWPVEPLFYDEREGMPMEQ